MELPHYNPTYSRLTKSPEPPSTNIISMKVITIGDMMSFHNSVTETQESVGFADNGTPPE